MKKLMITKDKDVPVSASHPARGKGRPVSPEIKAYIEAFAAFRPGKDSFFVEGATSADLEFLRKPFHRAGLGVLIRQVECDDHYQKPGVRVWRLAGEYDEI